MTYTLRLLPEVEDDALPLKRIVHMNLTKLQIAKYLFIANAIFVSVGYGLLAALAAIAYSPGPGPHIKAALTAFAVVFVILAIFWSLFCYGAYKGMTSERTSFKVIFWVFVICSMLSFPIGTAFAVALIYLRRAINLS